MERIIKKDYPLTLISKEEMAEYIQRFMESESFKNVVINEKNILGASDSYNKLSDYLTNYAIATGDLSNQSIEKIVKDFKENQDVFDKNSYKKTSRNPFVNHSPVSPSEMKQEYFKRCLMPMIVEKWREKLEITDINDLSSIIKIQEAISLQCKNNQYYTHSFNGALKEHIEANGLNIKNELFNDEYKSLSVLNGQDTPFKSGVLCYCELTENSFSYAPKSPERLHMQLNEGIKQQDNETPQEYYKRCLHHKIENPSTRLNTEQKSKIVENKVKIIADVEKMINFYYGQNKSCIAVWKQEKETNEPAKAEDLITTQFLSIKTKEYFLLKKDAELSDLFSDVELSIKNRENGVLDKMQNVLDMFAKKYPDNDTIKSFFKDSSAKIISEYCLNNFMYGGYGDGYIAEGGVIDRDKFSIATFDNPYSLYAEHQKELEQEKKQNENESQTSVLQEKRQNFLGRIKVEPTEENEKIIEQLEARELTKLENKDTVEAER